MVEPFAGGAAIFFHLRPALAILADVNAGLVELYQVVRDDPKSLIKCLRRLTNSSDEYYRIRQSVPRTSAGRAARLYYLQRFAFNGIYRENLRGEFNVPYGWKTSQTVCDPTEITMASATLQGAMLHHQDFRVTLLSVQRDDLVYIDPPYTVTHNRNGFIKYNSRLFSWRDQIELADLARQAAAKGAKVVVSNADHDEVNALYMSFERRTIHRVSKISADPNFRREITESLLIK